MQGEAGSLQHHAWEKKKSLQADANSLLLFTAQLSQLQHTLECKIMQRRKVFRLTQLSHAG